MTRSARTVELSRIDLTDLDLFADGFPHHVFGALRREAPVWWHEPTVHTPDGSGFWVVSAHAPVLEVVADAEAFSSERGPDAPGGGTLIQDLPYGWAAGVLLNMMDDPRHHQIRRVVTPLVAPRTLAGLEDELRARTRSILERAAANDVCDFLLDVAVELPLQATAILLGVPEDDRHDLMNWSNATLDYGDRELGETSPAAEAAAAATAAYGTALVADKKTSMARPGALPRDMLEALCAAAPELGLSDLELLMFFNLLIAAGSETTRNAIALGVDALAAHPPQLAILRDDPSVVPDAVEEILRWTSPTLYNRRTATRDAEIAGTAVRAGDKVTLWWASADMDEEVFAEPFKFDVRRRPNPHVAFGYRSHFCLGANLARMEIRIVLEELVAGFAAIEPVGPIERFRTNKHAGVKHMPVRLLRNR